MSKIQNLQQALEESSGREATRPKPSVAPPPSEPRLITVGKQPSRRGMVNISAWLPPDFKSSLRLVQARKGDPDLQDLIAEALNDLFTKYDVPTIRR